MFAIRALSRSAPRATSRLASYSTKATFRPTFQAALRSQRIPQLSRGFASSIARFDDAAQELGAKLDQEIQLEKEEANNPAESDGNIQSWISQHDEWKIHDVEGEQEVYLTRKYEDEDITLSFNIVDFNTSMMDGQHEEMDDALLDEEDEPLDTAQSGGANTKGAVNQGRTSGGNIKIAPEDSVAPGDREELRSPEEDESADLQTTFPVNVNVLVQRKGRGALRFNLVADSGTFSITNVTHIPDDKVTANKSAPEILREQSETLYTGPPFAQLDEEVQTLFESYLDARGINTHLALFVPEYIDIKEQKEYLEWLGRVRDFVE